MAKVVKTDGLKITINIDASYSDGISNHTVEEIRSELKEMGLDTNLKSH
ncbi:MAG: hypothetical protein H0U27_13350 [Nitrosopumilus sp.]|nr:hypothetical protein [Nitrosopumilus sp.]